MLEMHEWRLVFRLTQRVCVGVVLNTGGIRSRVLGRERILAVSKLIPSSPNRSLGREHVVGEAMLPPNATRRRRLHRSG